MNKKIYKEWKEYVSENNVAELDKYLKYLASQAVGLDVQFGHDEESIGLDFYIRTRTEIHSLCGCSIANNLKDRDLKKAVKDKHEVYLQLIQELFGENAIYNQGIGTYEQFFRGICVAKSKQLS